MTRVNSILIISIILMIGYAVRASSTTDLQTETEDNMKSAKEPANNLIHVDVTRTYSNRKELILQDFMDVEYVVLETKEGFNNDGYIRAVGDEFILTTNTLNDGDIFVYDRTGKALRKINRQGQGSEEYSRIPRLITLDEENNEMFINDLQKKLIIVYDLYGNFKRSFRFPEETMLYFVTYNYDKDNLIGYDWMKEKIGFLLISKQDGSITKEIKIPFKEKILPIKTMINSNGTYQWATIDYYRSIIPYQNNLLLLEISSDTVYTFLPDYSLRPFVVRTPSVTSMDPEILLIFSMLSDRYYFFETIRNEYNFSTRMGYRRGYFIYDTQEESFSGYNLYNGDYSIKREIDMEMSSLVDREIEKWRPLTADLLLEDYANGHLTGKLREIASNLKRGDNPVIMLIKHKK